MTARLSIPESVTDSVTLPSLADLPIPLDFQPPRRWAARLPRCNVCGAVMDLDSRSHRKTCSGRCRMKAHRKLRLLRPFVRIIARILEGDVPRGIATPPPFWGLIADLLLQERIAAKLRIKARALPGTGGDHE